jgi:hypothetical protein
MKIIGHFKRVYGLNYEVNLQTEEKENKQFTL